SGTEENGFIQNNLPLVIGIGVGALVLIGGLIFILISRRNRKEDKEFQETLAKGIGVDENLQAMQENESSGKISVQPDSKAQMAKEYAKDNPELAAELIKAWLRE
ncbi:hypothetical protein P7M27_25695, partial [Vibrio parahaemolyticus]|nr:hypothetical protein [Vibrio parahaemolyticus]